MLMSVTTDRRSFLFGASVAGFGILAQGRRGWAGGVGPNETLNIACIGVGGKGESDTNHAGRHGRVVALCDIDQNRLDAMAAKHEEAKKYNDFRELLHELDSRIDAVVVSTPDHTHAAAAVTAMRLGKHVYCQKPLAHSVWEARLMRETARQKGVCTQMGNQGTADPGFRRGAELVRSGAIGEVREVHIWTNRPFKYWKQSPDIVARPTDTPPIPKHVHWDLFLGTAPERPYNPVYHPHNWRGWWDFGTGSLGDMACHTANLTFMALQLGLPVRVSAKSGEINSETYPAWATITYEFPARGGQPPVKLTWYEGAKNGKRNLPDGKLFPDSGFQPSDSGSLLIGSKWRMYSPNDYGAVQMLWPAGEYKDLKVPERTLPRIEGAHGDDDGQKLEWVQAIRAGKPSLALSNFDYASTLTESMLLGNVAVRSGQAIDYNPETGEITGSSSASQYLKPYFRKGWEI
jgi:predicted dehydrogenase